MQIVLENLGSAKLLRYGWLWPLHACFRYLRLRFKTIIRSLETRGI